MTQMKSDVETFSTFCKKKGFFFQSSEIYGGLAGVYDYGPLGTAFKQRWCHAWRRHFLSLHQNFVEVDAPIIMPEATFKGSGHLKNFHDPIAHCSQCEHTERADKLIEKQTGEKVEGKSSEALLQVLQERGITCPQCGGDYAKVEDLNLMFPVDMGPKKGTRAYLRPETAQSAFVNFKTVYELQRKTLPLGIAMIGRVYRNEISPRNLLLRTREVEQAELQIFFNPNTIEDHPDFEAIKDVELKVLLASKREKEPIILSAEALLDYGFPKFYVYHLVRVQQFYQEIMHVPLDHFRFLELNEEEKAFYNRYHFDIEVYLPFHEDWIEVGGVHYRTDHDLKGHERESGEKMEVVDDDTGDRFIPHVLELSFGVGRNLQGLLALTYEPQAERGNDVLHLPQVLTPREVAIFPLVNKNGLPEKATQIYRNLVQADIATFYDAKGSVGKRYAREDEVGTRYCVTIDYETLDDPAKEDTVTIRDRETTEQKRIHRDRLITLIGELKRGERDFSSIENDA